MNMEVTEGIRNFILGGKAEFTIFQEPNSQAKYKVCKNDEGNLWFIYAEIDGRGLVYQGFITKKDPFTFKVGKNSKGYNEKAIKALMWVLRHSDKLPSIVHVLHHGKCSVCGRKLTDAESLQCGVGPTCRKKINI